MAIVLKKGNMLVSGSQHHICLGCMWTVVATYVSNEIMKSAAKEVFTSASDIVKKVFLEIGV